MNVRILELLASKRTANTLWSLAGNVVPALTAILFIPLLIKAMGVELFGLLTIIWIMIGYFSILDFGLGRSVTLLISQSLGSGRDNDCQRIYSTALPVALLLGAIACVCLYTLSGYIVNDFLKVSPEAIAEASLAIAVVSITLPFAVLSVMLRGVLESYGDFKGVNVSKLIMGIVTFAGPYWVYVLTESFSWSVVALLIARAGLCLSYFLRTRPYIKYRANEFRSAFLAQLFSVGGWMTVSNLISPLMTYLDRFFIGGVFSVAVVAYYATPYELVTKLIIFPASLMAVFFPVAAAMLMQDKKEQLRMQAAKYVQVIFVVMCAALAVVFFGGREILSLWVGEEFGNRSYWVMVILGVGVVFNAMAQVYFVVLQAAGLSSIPAKIHLCEAPVYIISLLVAVEYFPFIETVSLVWSGRVLVDFFLMRLFSFKFVGV